MSDSPDVEFFELREVGDGVWVDQNGDQVTDLLVWIADNGITALMIEFEPDPFGEGS